MHSSIAFQLHLASRSKASFTKQTKPIDAAIQKISRKAEKVFSGTSEAVPTRNPDGESPSICDVNKQIEELELKIALRESLKELGSTLPLSSPKPVALPKAEPGVVESYPPVGISNSTGSACFANSVFQNIMANPPLLEAILSAEGGTDRVQLKELISIYQGLASTETQCDFRDHLQSIMFGRVRQEDAAEALGTVLAKLGKVERVRSRILMAQVELEGATNVNVRETWSSTREKEKSAKGTLIEASIQLPNTVEKEIKSVNPFGCLGTCFLETIMETDSVPLLQLSLDSDESRLFSEALNTQHVLGSFNHPRWGFQTVVIGEESLYESQQVTTLSRPTDFFVLEIGRAKHDGHGVVRGKLTIESDHIQIPGKCFGESKDVPYRLTGFGSHLGSQQSSGHYVAYVTRWIGDEWKYYYVNDSVSTEVTRQMFLDSFSGCSVAFFEKEKNLDTKPLVLADMPQVPETPEPKVDLVGFDDLLQGVMSKSPSSSPLQGDSNPAKVSDISNSSIVKLGLGFPLWALLAARRGKDQQQSMFRAPSISSYTRLRGIAQLFSPNGNTSF